MKPIKKNPQPVDVLSLMSSETARLYWEGILLLSLSMDGYLITAATAPLLFTLGLRLMIATYVLGYILGTAPILVREMQRQLETGRRGTSKLIILIFMASVCAVLLIEPILRLVSATQIQGKSIGPGLLLIAFVLFHLIRSRKEIRELLTTNRSAETRAPIVALSLRVTYLIAILLLRASLLFTAFTISSGGLNPWLYVGALLMILLTCSLFRKQLDE